MSTSAAMDFYGMRDRGHADEASSSDSEDEGTDGKTRGVGKKFMIEIKPLDAMPARPKSMNLDNFSFAPPPRARGGTGVVKEETNPGDSELFASAFDRAGKAEDIGNELEALAFETTKPNREPVKEVSEKSQEAVTVVPSGRKPPARGGKAKAKSIDPYDMLDSIVGGNVGDVGGAPAAVKRVPAAKQETQRPSASDGGKSPDSTGPPSGPISPRGQARGRSSFGAETAFYEELAQISLPDSDTINPQREFRRGLALFDANKLSEALFAFVAAAVNAVHSQDPVAFQCASYATTCKILRDTSTFLVGNVRECARLTRHLVMLPHIEERHRRASLRFASAKNFKAGNAGTASRMIKELMNISPAETLPNLQAMLRQCQSAGDVDSDIPENEDPSKMCAATLESIPRSQNGIHCTSCGALHSTKAAFETGQCVICRSTLSGSSHSVEHAWF
jgi:hypothetical protein